MTVPANIIDAQDNFLLGQQQQWIAAAIDGDRQAYQQLYQAHVGKVYALCLRMLADKDAAEDVCQEVFVQVWLKLGSFRGDSQFSTWLHRVATNQVFSHLRRQKSWLQRIISRDDDEVAPAVADHPEFSDLDRQIMRLPARARQVFVLFAIEGYRHEEIATMMNIAVGSSKAQYHRARQLLQEWVTQ